MTTHVKPVIETLVEAKLLPRKPKWLRERTEQRYREVLLEREDRIADLLRIAGAQYGVYPQIVSEVIASIGIGTPPTEEERALIRQNYINLLAWLREQHGQQG